MYCACLYSSFEESIFVSVTVHTCSKCVNNYRHGPNSFLALSLSFFFCLEPCVLCTSAGALRAITLYHNVRDSSKALHFSASSKTISFYNKDTRGEIQKAVFNEEQVKRVFHGSFHKVNVYMFFFFFLPQLSYLSFILLYNVFISLLSLK